MKCLWDNFGIQIGSCKAEILKVSFGLEVRFGS